MYKTVYDLALSEFQNERENRIIIAYISNLPASINAAAYNLPGAEKILKFPPVIAPNAVPLLVIQARTVEKVVSIS